MKLNQDILYEFPVMKGTKPPGQALDSGGFAAFSASRGGVFPLAFPALASLGNHPSPTIRLSSGPSGTLQNMLC